MNVFSPYLLRPWSATTASACLNALATTYEIHLSAGIRESFCRRIRSCVPHHVQQFFDAVHRHLRIARRAETTFEIADRAYREDMLGARGQIDMDHYEERLKVALSSEEYAVALERLARAARARGLDDRSNKDHPQTLDASADFGADSMGLVLGVLQQDGYLVRQGQQLRFASGLLASIPNVG